MGVFQSIGKGAGNLGGFVIGGSVKVTGKVVGSKLKDAGNWLEEVGEAVQSASKSALNVGQFVDGTVQGTYGLVKKDEVYKQRGMDDLKDSARKTVKGISSSLKYTVNNAGSTYKGIRTGNKEEVINGLRNIGKIVAVSGLAIGIVDVVDGVHVEEVDSINDGLNGYEHPDTGVLFLEKTLDLPNGQMVEGTFPVFQSFFTVEIAEELYLENDSVHFGVANDTLYQAIQEHPNIAHELGISQTDLSSGQTPVGYSWHHNEEMGILQLVDEEIHAKTAHTGGRSIWGGGSEYR